MSDFFGDVAWRSCTFWIRQFAAPGREFHPQPTSLRNKGSHPKCGSPGSRPTRSQHEVDGNVGHLEVQMPCVRRVTFLDGSIAWTPTRRVPTLQVHVAVHNLPLDVDSNCIHVEFLQVLEARIELLRLEFGRGPLACRGCTSCIYFQGPGASLASRVLFGASALALIEQIFWALATPSLC